MTTPRAGSRIFRHLSTSLIGCLLLTVAAVAQVPVTFTLDQPGYVTLVIEDQAGNRVRNLIGETFFEAGEHTVIWDGYDIGERVSIRREGRPGNENFYDIHRRLVAPGTYRVRGLVHDGVGLRYEVSVQSPGTPPWHTPDGSGAWLSDHGTPTSVLSLPRGSMLGSEPQVIVGSPIAETGHSVMWLTLDGRKLRGAKVQGWQGALALTDDPGPKPASRYAAYCIAERKGKLYVHGLQAKPDDGNLFHQIASVDMRGYDRLEQTMVDVAAYNGVVLVSQPKDNTILVFNTGGRAKDVGQIQIDNPRGLTFTRSGELFLLSGNRLLHFAKPNLSSADLGQDRIITEDLQDPRRLTVGPDGSIYVSDWGDRHQVVVFGPDGRQRRMIGQPGGPQIGRYDERRMHNPTGVAIDARGRLWVAEADYSPKRISLWNADGSFNRAFYGPPKYGGGGFIDPIDPSRFYYSSGLQGIEFAIDWQTGESKPTSIYYLRAESDVGARTPDYPVYIDGRQYMVNCYGVRPFGWKASDASVYLMDEQTRQIEHVARVGSIDDYLRKVAESDPAVAERLISDGKQSKFNFYVWSDLNRDKVPQADEIQAYAIRDKRMTSRPSGGVLIAPDLSIATSAGLYVPPPRITDNGVPVWDLSKLEIVTDQGSYQGDVIRTHDGYTILTGGPIYAYRDGKLAWTYHSQWPKRGGAVAPPPAYPGQLVATSRIIGDTVCPREGEAGEVWAINSDKGSIFLLTSDGLFVAELGGDLRVTPPMQLPEAKRGMLLPRVSFNDEHFWPAIMQLADGRIMLTIGKEHSSLFSLQGLDSVRRIPPASVVVEPQMLAGKPDTLIEPAVVKERKQMTIAMAAAAPSLKGDAGEWVNADWQTIDVRRNISAAMQVHGQTLYVAYRGPADLLRNRLPDGWQHAFATGGGLDLMIRTQPQQDVPEVQKRHRTGETASAGDVRLVVTRSDAGRVVAVRYEQKRAGGADHPAIFDSPIGNVRFDSVTDVSSQVRLEQHGELYELAIPLRVLGLDVRPGLQTLGDLGVLIGDGRDTYARLYWNNRHAGIATDLPSEARLTPEWWGQWTFQGGR